MIPLVIGGMLVQSNRCRRNHVLLGLKKLGGYKLGLGPGSKEIPTTRDFALVMGVKACRLTSRRRISVITQLAPCTHIVRAKFGLATSLSVLCSDPCMFRMC